MLPFWRLPAARSGERGKDSQDGFHGLLLFQFWVLGLIFRYSISSEPGSSSMLAR